MGISEKGEMEKGRDREKIRTFIVSLKLVRRGRLVNGRGGVGKLR